MKLYVYDYKSILYFSAFKIHFDPSAAGLSSLSFREGISSSAQQLEVGWNLPVSSADACPESHSLLGWGPQSFSIPIHCLRHSFTTSRFVAPQSVGEYKLVVSHKQWLYLQVPLNTQRTGTFYFLKSYKAKMLRTVLTDALGRQDTDWYFRHMPLFGSLSPGVPWRASPLCHKTSCLPPAEPTPPRTGEQAVNGGAARVLPFVGNGPETAPLLLERKFASAQGRFSIF